MPYRAATAVSTHARRDKRSMDQYGFLTHSSCVVHLTPQKEIRKRYEPFNDIRHPKQAKNKQTKLAQPRSDGGYQPYP